MNRQIVNPGSPSPILEDHPLSAVGVVAIILGVSRLRMLCRPSAICGPSVLAAIVAVAASIVACRVYAVDGVLTSWSWPHISDEGFNGTTPPLADEPANTAIKTVIVGTGIVAPGNHQVPDFELTHTRKTVPSVRYTVAVRANIPHEMVRSYISLCAARFTLAYPLNATATLFALHSAERSDEIANLNGGWTEDSLLVSHDVALRDRVTLWLEPTGVSAPVRLASFYGGSVEETNAGAV